MPLEDFIIIVYCCVERELKNIVKNAAVRTRGFAPKLSDAEIITMELVGEFLGIDADKHIWRYFKQHWRDWFPSLGSRSNFVRQAANLWQYKKRIQQIFADKMGAINDSIHLIDGLPMPICKYKRSNRCKRFKNQAAFGYCASKDEKYYGFHGHLSVNFDGIISDFDITAANIDEREVMMDFCEKIRGLLIGDKGYISEYKKETLRSQQVDLQTPLRDNMKDERSPAFVKQLMRVRRKIETVIGQLAEQFNFEKILARDLWHLTNRLTRKILAHTIGVFINKMLGRPPLQLEGLVKF